ncbi:MAG: hypothetical protein ACE5DM_03330 [Candidatus Nanoarchaeia archaeon]
MEFHSFCRRFTAIPIRGVQKIDDDFYLVEGFTNKILSKITAKLGKKPLHAGTYMGSMRRRDFIPSFSLLDILVIIDDKAEWLFLCRRDVLGKAVMYAGVEKGIVLVENKNREVLGYGRIIGDQKQKKKVFLKNIFDRGDFLRRERSRF